MRGREANPRRSRRGVGVVAGVLSVLLVWGGVELVRNARELQGYGDPSAREIDEALQEMRHRSPFEEMQGSSSALLDEIRSALEGEFGSIVWQYDPVENGVLGCTNAESENSGARSENARVLGAVSLDGAQTERAIDIVSTVARENGFARTSRVVDGTGDQYIDLSTERGGRVTLVTGDPIGISVSTDCFLTAERLAELQSDD